MAKDNDVAGEGDGVYSSERTECRPRAAPRGGVALIALAIAAMAAISPVAPSLATVSAPSDIAGPAECKPGRECVVEGALFVKRRNRVTTARIDTASGCFAVALTDPQRKAIRQKHGGFARITGTGYLYSWRKRWKSYRVADRTAGNGGCRSGTMLYATRVEAAH